MSVFVRGLFVFVVLLSTALTLAPAQVSASNWQLQRNEDGVRVYTRPEKGSPYDAFRAVVSIKVPFEKLLAVMADTPNNCRWMHGCDQSVVLNELSFNDRYVYQVNDVPAPLWPRDMIMHTRASINDARDEVIINVRAVPDYCDQARVSACRGRDQSSSARSYVRIERAEGFYQLRKLSSGGTEVVWQMHAEPGGEIVGWMANMTLTDIPLKSLARLKTYAERNAAKRAHFDLQRYAAND